MTLSLSLRLRMLVAREVSDCRQCAEIEQRSDYVQSKADVQTWTSTRPCVPRKKGAFESVRLKKLSGETEPYFDCASERKPMEIIKL